MDGLNHEDESDSGCPGRGGSGSDVDYARAIE
jgi:hypothetical protein